ncbi:MAG: NAD(P)-binding protein [Deltaproteobacteria bacterium]|nr:NAD(P)-binding protein [Deltaproteobacteria bacterium]
MSTESNENHILDFALNYEYPPYRVQDGLKRVVAFGDASHKCPTYQLRVPPCTTSCPAGEDIRGVQNILRGVEKTENKWEAAWRRIVDRNPFPAVMGRVCPHPCQGGCNRKEHDESVAINTVEHALGNYAIENNLKLDKPAAATGKKVAVVGGGPAGLSAAYQLARKGHKVTLFDSREKLGGMMRYGIMGYRVNRDVLDAEIQRIVELGIEIRMNTRIGSDVTLDELKSGYDAVFLGMGAQKGVGLPVPGFEEAPQATNAIEFLIEFEAKGGQTPVGENLVVIGDGNVAMDVARLARRLGSKATVLSAVPREEMACFDEEYDDALAEGTGFQLQVSVKRVISEGGRVTGVECVKMEKKQSGEEGYNSPVPFLRYKPVAGSEFTLQCDMVVAAIGQATDLSGLGATAEGQRWLSVGPDFRVKGEEKVFAGGDALKIDLITTAVGHGRKAAEAIHDYMNGIEFKGPGREDIIRYDRLFPYYFPNSESKKRGRHIPENIKGDFRETMIPLPSEEIVAESERCMSCGLCFECRQCQMFCPQEAVSYRKEKPVGEVMFTDYTRCVGCHICYQVCPTGYIHMGMGEDL